MQALSTGVEADHEASLAMKVASKSFPHACHMWARLADGGFVVLRPLRRGETMALKKFFDSLSAHSRSHGHYGSASRLSFSTRRVFADVDGGNYVGWVALASGFPVGICRYVRTALDTAEIAFEVVDAEQGRGVGSALLDAVATVASANRVEWLEAFVVPENAASVALLARVGVTVAPSDGVVESRGRLQLPGRARVNRRAVLTLAGHTATRTGDET